jgi:hypothetical protein
MRPEWRAYLQRLPYEAVFLHRDEWRNLHQDISEPLLAIFLQQGSERPRVLVRAAEMPLGQSLDHLMALLDERLAAQRGGQAV